MAFPFLSFSLPTLPMITPIKRTIEITRKMNATRRTTPRRAISRHSGPGLAPAKETHPPQTFYFCPVKQ
jgi:hypothetical protein